MPVIFLLGLTLTSGAFASEPDAASQRLEALTQSLAGLNNAYQNASPNARANALDDLLSVAIERHALLHSIIESNPDAVLQGAVTYGIRASLPEEVHAYIEQEVTLSGDLQVMYEDYEDGSHRLLHFLKADNEHIPLHFKSNPPTLPSGVPAMAHGIFLQGGADTDGAMALESGDNVLTLAIGGEGSEGSPGEQGSIGEQTTAVILVNFLNNLDEPISVSAAHELVFSTTDSYMRESSSGINWLSGLVFGWYNLAIDETCNSVDIAAAAQQAATASGVDLSQYSRFIYMFPRNSSCGWSGVGTVGGIPSESWINGNFELKVVGHELGHNYTLQHAQALDCGTEIEGENCNVLPYGDNFDIMGNSNSAHFSAFHKERLGWLTTANLDIVEVDASGLYALDVFENDFGTRVLKIPKGLDPAGMQTWYYLEYRQAIGFDAFLQDHNDMTNGIIIRTGTDQDPRSSYLYDMTPNSSLYYDWYDSALTVGSTYQDDQAGVTVTVVAVDGVTAQVDITLTGGGGSGGGNPPVNQPPVAVADATVTPLNTSINIPVLSNDYDLDNEAISVQSATSAANGTVTVKADGTIEYKPRRKFTGIDTFTYQITDGTDNSSATVTVDVQGSSGGNGGGKGGGKGGKK